MNEQSPQHQFASDSTVYVVEDDFASQTFVCGVADSLGVPSVPFASAEAFLRAFRVDLAGCLVTDVRMMGMTGMELQERLVAAGSTLPVIIITGYAETSLAVKAMQNGAVTVLEKPVSYQQLREAIRDALRLDAEQRDAARHRRTVLRKLTRLTSAERQVMELVVAGKLNKVIASELDVSLRTVEARRQRIFQKLGVDNVACLVRLLADADQLPEPPLQPAYDAALPRGANTL